MSGTGYSYTRPKQPSWPDEAGSAQTKIALIEREQERQADDIEHLQEQNEMLKENVNKMALAVEKLAEKVSIFGSIVVKIGIPLILLVFGAFLKWCFDSVGGP